jgi:poly-gamma-glutamate synthesis protein (capsule biosynthesis protein)
MAHKGKYEKPREKRKRPCLIPFWIVVLIIGIIGAVNSCDTNDYGNNAHLNSTTAVTEASTSHSEPWLINQTEVSTTEATGCPEATEGMTDPSTKQDPIAYTASVGAMGDLLMHKPVFDAYYHAAVYQTDGTYNFESVFKYIDDYVTTLDYAAVNLETTLCGTKNGYPYSGYPNFNCPDSIVTGIKDAGFDMLLTANNHSSDTGIFGYKRTLEVVREAGVATLGTHLTSDETKWAIQNINGIDIGMMCYTWALNETSDGRPSLNGNAYIPEVGLCNYFHSNNLDKFYKEVERYISEMKASGADATIMFIHWGEEYKTYANDDQKRIAQKLCDLGIDVIVGAHPHVIQPIDLIESTVDPEHKTVCIYSTGNAISNQRQGNISAIKTAHTEDGILFSVTFKKVDDGETYVTAIDVLPTWVNRFNNKNGRREYNIIPLDMEISTEWQEMFGLSDSAFKKAIASYERTMEIVGDGLLEVEEWIAERYAVG